MEVGQPGTGAPKGATEALAKAMDQSPLGYTVSLGLPALRKRVAQLYGEWYDVDLNPGRVISTATESLPEPTHLLKDNVARPLASVGSLLIEPRDGALHISPAPGLTLNDAPLTAESRVELGDVIGTPEGNFTAIRLEP